MKKALIGIALAAIVSASPALAKRTTAQYTSITTFGDSLVDAGNVFAATAGTTPPSALGYFNGRFTNGYNYNDLLSIDLFGTPTVASTTPGGLNFAWGGARATTTSAVPDLLEQLAIYNAFLGGGGTVDPNGLYILNFGGNDLFNVPGQFALAAANIATGVQTLNNLGARNILVTGFPPVADANTVMQAETALVTSLAGLSLNSDTTLMRFSYISFFQTALANPTALGLPVGLNMNPAQNCRDNGAQASNCAGYFYFDSVHPTAQVQLAAYNAMNAQFGLTAVQAVPEPGTWAMMIAGFGLIGAALRRARPRVRLGYAAA